MKLPPDDDKLRFFCAQCGGAHADDEPHVSKRRGVPWQGWLALAIAIGVIVWIVVTR